MINLPSLPNDCKELIKGKSENDIEYLEEDTHSNYEYMMTINRYDDWASEENDHWDNY